MTTTPEAGMRLVPVCATARMMDAGVAAMNRCAPDIEGRPGYVMLRAAFDAMLAAAPVPSAGGEGEALTFDQRLSLDRVRQWLDRHPLTAIHPDDVRAVYDLAARAQPPGGEVVNSAHAAYGALWCMVTDNPAIHAARNHLLAAIGGRGSDAQREAIKWAGRHVQPPSDAEIMAIDAHPAEPAARDGSNGVPWAGDDERWDRVREAWESYLNEHIDEYGRVDLSEVDTAVSIALTRAFILAAGGEK